MESFILVAVLFRRGMKKRLPRRLAGILRASNKTIIGTESESR